MGDVSGGEATGIDVLPIHVGESTYAVKLDRVATVLRTGVLEDADPGTVIELSEHTVEIADAGQLLGDRSVEPNAVVVFHGRASNGHVPGWLVSEVDTPSSVGEVRATVGSTRPVRGKVSIDGTDVVLIDPIRIHHS
jgi:hypothetical protein